MRAVLSLALATALLLASCRFPDDPEGTLERVEGGTARVGVSESEPWVELDGRGRPTGGMEIELVRRFARDLDARVEWVDGSEEQLVEALKEGSLDLVVGGMTNRSRWKRDVAFTRPYATTKTVVGAPPGRELSGDLDGVRVRAELGSEAEALVDAKTDAEVVTVTSLASSRGLPTAAEEYVLDDLGLRPSEVVLKEDKHVMAVRFGENAWLVRLERFLQRREGQIARRIVELGRP